MLPRRILNAHLVIIIIINAIINISRLAHWLHCIALGIGNEHACPGLHVVSDGRSMVGVLPSCGRRGEEHSPLPQCGLMSTTRYSSQWQSVAIDDPEMSNLITSSPSRARSS